MHGQALTDEYILNYRNVNVFDKQAVGEPDDSTQCEEEG